MRKQQPRRPPAARRARRPHPLDIRGWVAEKSPDEIWAVLTQRIEAIQEVVEPHRARVEAFLQYFSDQVLRPLGLPSGPVSPERVSATCALLRGRELPCTGESIRTKGSIFRP
jgi:hypothetical protein